MPKITVEPDYTDADFAGAVEELLAEGTLVTSPRVAERVGCSRELARQYLVARAEEGALKRDRVGGGAVVYLPPDDTLESARNFRLASAQDGVAPAQSDDDTDSAEKVAPTRCSSTRFSSRFSSGVKEKCRLTWLRGRTESP